ncbi:MAG: AAA family ATPase [Candidatus Nanopelagicales bacterium]
MNTTGTDVTLVDGWLVDAAGHRLSRAGEERHLEPRVMQLLLTLVARPGEVIARDDLKRAVWGDTYVTDDAVSAAVIKLRRALDDPARKPRVILTVAKSGYRLAADAVQGATPPADDAVHEPAVRVGTVLHVRVDLDGDAADPEAWQRAADEVAAVVAVEADRSGGWTVAEPGSVLAVIGVPRAREDHAARAARCATAVVTSLDGRLVDGASLRVRCGLATGELVVVARGRVSGAAVQEASDLAARAVSGQVLLAADTSEALGNDAWETVEGARRLLDAPVPGSSWEVRRSRGLTPFVGRAPDLGALELLAQEADRGHGQVVVLSGEPGVGKSRLVHELRSRLQSQGWATALGSTSSLDSRSPYVAVRRLLQDAGREAASDQAAWAAVVAADGPDASWSGLDPVLRQQRVTEMALELLVPGDTPSLVAVEDAHWADEATRALLSQLAERIARRRCLLVITTRPVGDEPWSDRSHGTRRRVGPLYPDEAQRLLDLLVADDAGLEDWKRDVLERSAGTPLFLEECARTATSGPRGAASPVVPRSLRGLLAERVDSLAADARTVVARASVVGRSGTTDLLRQLVDLDDAAFLTAYDAAVSSEILRPLRLRDGAGWEFSHALLQEAAYAGIPRAVRRETHRTLADLLTGEGSAGATAARVAWHLTEAGEVDEALAAWLRAARDSAEADAFADALAHLGRATELLDRLPEGDDRRRLELEIALATGTASVQTVGPADPSTGRAFVEAVDLAETVGSPEQVFEALWGTWFVTMHAGDLREADDIAKRIWTLVPDLDDSALVLEAHHVQWSGLLLLGRTAEALHHARAALEIYRPEEHHRLTYSYGGHDPGVCARNLGALALWLQGDDVDSAVLAADSVDLAARLRHPYSQIEACHAALTIAAVEGRSDAMPAHLDVLDALLEQDLVPEASRGYVDGFRAAMARGRGDTSEALHLFERGSEQWRAFWGPWCLPLDTLWAETLRDHGDVEAAEEVLATATSIAAESSAPWWDAEILRVSATLPGVPTREAAALRRRAEQAGADVGSARLVERVTRDQPRRAARGRASS